MNKSGSNQAFSHLGLYHLVICPVSRTLKLTLAYDGTDFAGWQIQAGNQRTLQGTLEDTLTKVTGQFSRVFASGRTDAGVHALGQVVSFDTECALPLDVFQKALNAELPRDMAVLSAEEAPQGFSARSDAKRKRYRYVIQDGPVRNVFQLRYAWHLFQRMDVGAMSRGRSAGGPARFRQLPNQRFGARNHRAHHFRHRYPPLRNPE